MKADGLKGLHKGRREIRVWKTERKGEEGKWAIRQTRLFDTDKSFLFRATGELQSKYNRVVWRMDGCQILLRCQILLCCPAEAFGRAFRTHLADSPMWHMVQDLLHVKLSISLLIDDHTTNTYTEPSFCSIWKLTDTKLIAGWYIFYWEAFLCFRCRMFQVRGLTYLTSLLPGAKQHKLESIDILGRWVILCFILSPVISSVSGWCCTTWSSFLIALSLANRPEQM